MPRIKNGPSSSRADRIIKEMTKPIDDDNSPKPARARKRVYHTIDSDDDTQVETSSIHHAMDFFARAAEGAPSVKKKARIRPIQDAEGNDDADEYRPNVYEEENEEDEDDAPVVVSSKRTSHAKSNLKGGPPTYADVAALLGGSRPSPVKPQLQVEVEAGDETDPEAIAIMVGGQRKVFQVIPAKKTRCYTSVKASASEQTPRRPGPSPVASSISANRPVTRSTTSSRVTPLKLKVEPSPSTKSTTPTQVTDNEPPVQARELTDLRKYLSAVQGTLQQARAIYNLQHITIHLYPTPAIKEAFATRALAMANQDKPLAAQVNIEFYPMAGQVIMENSSKCRTRLKSHAQAAICGEWPEVFDPRVSTALRKATIAQLLEDCNFVYGELRFHPTLGTVVETRGPFRNKAIWTVLKTGLFGRGTNGEGFLFPELWYPFPLPAIAAAAITVMYALEQWKTGEKDDDYQFQETRYADKYEYMLDNLEGYAESPQTRAACVELQQEILAFVYPNYKGKGKQAAQPLFVKLDGSEEIQGS